MSVREYTGADLISDFISEFCYSNVFLVTGGACAFIIDAIGINPKTSYTCFQHEQSAAMAADAIWRTIGRVGVTVSTSGPGATNLITGIACSWFDSIPAIHFTGQVNQSESREALGANVRQGGFQETDIVNMVSTITKFAKKIESIDELVDTLPRAYLAATDGRMGPVLLDVPMDIQKSSVTTEQKMKALKPIQNIQKSSNSPIDVREILSNSKRPVVIIGAGAALAGTAILIQEWCEKYSIPYVCSWGAFAYIDRSKIGYFGTLGVYGSRKANWLIQSADELLVFGSRLDNRQRTGNPSSFAPFANVHVLDIDLEELRKFKTNRRYRTYHFNLKLVSDILFDVGDFTSWILDAKLITSEMKSGFDESVDAGELNPYKAIQLLQDKFDKKSIVVADTGANLCWVYQSYEPDETFIFTAGGNSPMGYSLPAAIGAQIANPQRKVFCFIGDGGLQMNIQELQTVVSNNLSITIIVLNNFGYGIIKQFQDAYLEGRHIASGEGYSVPNFKLIASAYKIPFQSVNSEKLLELTKIPKGYSILEVCVNPNALITPKTEVDRFLHDQYPYNLDNSISKLPYKYPLKPSSLDEDIN